MVQTLRMGDFQHPWGMSVLGSAGFDSNVAYTSGDNNLSEKVDPALRLYLGGEYHNSSQGLFDPKHLGLKYGYTIASGLNMYVDPEGKYLSPRLQLDLSGEVLRRYSRNTGLSLFAKLHRYSEPHRLFPDSTYSWDLLNAGMTFKTRPNGGLFSFEGKYNLQSYLFEDDTLSHSDRLTNIVNLKLAYDVLFKTQVWVSGFGSYYYYPFGDQNLGSVNSLYASGMLGVSTPITLNLGISLGGGYARGWYDANESPSGWVYSAFLYYNNTNVARVRVGVLRRYLDSLLGTYQDLNRFYTRFFFLMPNNKRISFEGNIYVDLATHHSIPATRNSPENNQTITVLSCSSNLCARSDFSGYIWLKGAYALNKDMNLYLTYRFQWLSSEFRTQSINYYTNQISVQNPSFIKHLVMLNLSYSIY